MTCIASCDPTPTAPQQRTVQLDVRKAPGVGVHRWLRLLPLDRVELQDALDDAALARGDAAD